MTYPVTLTLPLNTDACVQNWRRVIIAGEVRIETTYNEPFTLAAALVISGKMDDKEAARLVRIAEEKERRNANYRDTR